MVQSQSTATSQSLLKQLIDLLTAETRSLARHLEHAKPYVSQASYLSWVHIQKILSASSNHEQRLTKLIAHLGVLMPTGTFCQEVASFHDMDLATLLPRLINEKTQQAVAYRRALDQAANPSVASELQALLDELQDQLTQLQGG